MYCNKCGAEADTASNFCASCGAPLQQTVRDAAESQVKIEASEPPSPGGQSDKLGMDEMYRAFIGPEKSPYYLPLFERFDAHGGAASWNWAAAFITQLWMLYKGMFLWGFLWYPILGGVASFLIALPFVASGNEGAEAISYLVYFVGSVIVMGLFSNKIYHGHVKKKIEKSGRLGLSDKERKEWLIRKGASNFVFVFVMILVLISVIGILAAIAIPAYQDYTNRARVADGLSNADFLKDRYLEHVVSTRSWPTSIEDLGVEREAAQFGSNVNRVEIGQDHKIKIIFSGGNIDGASVTWTPLIKDDTLSWKCQVESLPTIYAPASCRGSSSTAEATAVANSAPAPTPIPPTKAKRSLSSSEQGEIVYSSYCAACHQMDGSGLRAANFPALTGTDFSALDKQIAILLAGKNAMASFDYLKDEEISGVLNFCAKRFGGLSNDHYTPEMVRKARK